MVFILYVLKMVLRFIVSAAAFIIYFKDKQALEQVLNFNLKDGNLAVYFVWLFIEIDMILQFVPVFGRYYSCGRFYKSSYLEPENGYNSFKLKETSDRLTRRGYFVFLFWVVINIIFGVLLPDYELILLSAFYFICDMICILIWCPFQLYINKNRCCKNCRLFVWGYFMFCLPMAFVNSFFTKSLFVSSLIIFISWEINFFRHPERFWEGSNVNLRCENCKDKLCRIKKITNKLIKF